MDVINPRDIEYLFDNDDKSTSTVGIGYDEMVKGQIVRKIKVQVIKRNEARQLERLMKARDAEVAKLKKAAGQPPPDLTPKKREAKVLVDPTGKPVSMNDVMKVRKKKS